MCVYVRISRIRRRGIVEGESSYAAIDFATLANTCRLRTHGKYDETDRRLPDDDDASSSIPTKKQKTKLSDETHPRGRSRPL